MLLASAEAFALAYYSIQVGQLSIVGVVRLSDVVAAFGITAAQFAMPAWVAHVARLSRLATPRQLVLPTRHWLLFAAVFALFAAFVSETERRRRHAVLGPRPAWLDAFNRRQRADQLGASATGTLMLAAWALALVLTGSHPIAAVVCLAVALMAIAGAFAWALRAQQSTVEELLRALTT